MNIPIIIIGRNRLHFLELTLRSIFASVENPDVWYFDDGSTDIHLFRYITTNDEFEILPLIYPSYHELWKKHIGKLPKVEKIKGIKDKVKVHLMNKQYGTTRISFYAINNVFKNYPDIPYLFKLEDDIILKYNWYQTMISEMKEDIGVLGGMNFSSEPSVFFTAQCYLINKNISELPQNKYSDNSFDVHMCKISKEKGYKIKLVRPAVGQHIGYSSSLWKNVLYFERSNVSLCPRIDLTAFPPYCL